MLAAPCYRIDQKWTLSEGQLLTKSNLVVPWRSSADATFPRSLRAMWGKAARFCSMKCDSANQLTRDRVKLH